MKKSEAFSIRVQDLKGSPIRETLRMVSRPGLVSFAGGLPSPRTFPLLGAGKIPGRYLQYGPTEGEAGLRDLLARELRAQGLDCGAQQVLVLSGSQQGIDLAAKLFIDRGTRVAVESPTYLAALQVFRFFGARFTPLDPNEPDLGREKPALVYLNPTFQNPTGRCLSHSQRRAVARECDKRGVTLLEDDPYRELAYGPCDRAPIASFVRKTDWIYQGSFSKTFAPGLRLGYLASSKRLVPYLHRLKQAADLHSNRLSQWLAMDFLRTAGRKSRGEKLASCYRRKRDAFVKALEEHFGELADWTVPNGGLFFWLSLKRKLDTRTLFNKALARGVAFMPGEHFFAQTPPPLGFLRLNFSHATGPEVDRGLSLLAGLIRNAGV